MTMLWPAQNNPLNIFARSDKSQNSRQAVHAPSKNAFKSTLTEAGRKRPALAETAENRRPEAPEPMRRAEKPEPAEREKPTARSAHEPAEARESGPDRQPDEAAAADEGDVTTRSQQAGEARSGTEQAGDGTSPQRQESTQPVAQQPAPPAQGLLIVEPAGEASSPVVQPAGATEPQAQPPQAVALPIEPIANTTAPTESRNAATIDQTAERTPLPIQAGDAASRIALESLVPRNDLESSDQSRPAQGEAEAARPTSAAPAQDQLRPADRPASVSTTSGQNALDPAARGDRDQSASQRQTDGDDRGSKQENRQASRWVMSGENRSNAIPAVARAAQVEAGVRLENATAQAPSAELGGRTVLAAVPLGQIRIDSLGTISQTTGSGEDRASGAKSMAEAPFTGRVIRGLTAMINQRGGVMNMRLEPPELGDLRVHMTINRGHVSALFQVSNAEAQSMLERSLGSLRAALESQGLTVERLHVHLPSANSSQDMREENSEQQQQSRGHADAGQGQSRGRGEGDEPLNHQPSSRHANRPFAEAFASVPRSEEGTGQ